MQRCAPPSHSDLQVPPLGDRGPGSPSMMMISSSAVLWAATTWIGRASDHPSVGRAGERRIIRNSFFEQNGATDNQASRPRFVSRSPAGKGLVRVRALCRRRSRSRRRRDFSARAPAPCGAPRRRFPFASSPPRYGTQNDVSGAEGLEGAIRTRLHAVHGGRRSTALEVPGVSLRARPVRRK